MNVWSIHGIYCNLPSCSKFGQRLAIFSKSRSFNPRIAAKNIFFRFGQPFRKRSRLSPGDASSRKLSTEHIYSVTHLCEWNRPFLLLTTIQSQLLPIRRRMLPTLSGQLMIGRVISTYRLTEYEHYIEISLLLSDPYSPG